MLLEILFVIHLRSTQYRQHDCYGYFQRFESYTQVLNYSLVKDILERLELKKTDQQNCVCMQTIEQLPKSMCPEAIVRDCATSRH